MPAAGVYTNDPATLVVAFNCAALRAVPWVIGAGVAQVMTGVVGPPPTGVNVAPQVRGPAKANRMLAAVPVQSPVHAVNVYPELAVALSPMLIDTGIVTEQAVPPAPQLMPAACTFPPVGGVIVNVYGGPDVCADAGAAATANTDSTRIITHNALDISVPL